MQISPFLLHYPDGSVAIGIKDEQKPDAFLLSSSKGIAYWVSLNFSAEVMSIQEAQKKDRTIKIDHERCSLLPISVLWYLFTNCQKINLLLENLGLKPIPKGYFWVKPQGRHFLILQFKNEEPKHNLCIPLNKDAMVIAGVEQILSKKALNSDCKVALVPKRKKVIAPQNSLHPERYRARPRPLRQH